MKRNERSREHMSVDEYLDSAHSREKIWNYLNRLSDEPSFIKQIKKFRKKYGLPVNGLEEVKYIKGSKGYSILESIKELDTRESRGELVDFTKKLGISGLWTEHILYFVAYGQWFNFSSYGADLLYTDDIKSSLHGPFTCEDEKEAMQEYIASMAEEYPVAIFINPYASQNDILDFVKKAHKKHIEPMLKKYRDPDVLLGKTRRKNMRIKERNDFIYAHKQLSKKKLVSLVADKYGEIMDYPYLNKIIAEEERKRK